MSARIAPTSRITAESLGKIPTTRARRLISLLTRSINRPSGGGQPAALCRSCGWESGQVALQGVGDVPVAGCFACPAAVFGVGLQGGDVGELVGQGGGELGCWGVVVAGFAD